LEDGELKHFEKPLETFKVRNFDSLNSSLGQSALPLDVNPIAEFNFNSDRHHFNKLSQRSCAKTEKERNANEYNVPLWVKFFPKYSSLHKPMVKAFPELYWESDLLRFPATCGLADTLECEFFEGAPKRYDWTD